MIQVEINCNKDIEYEDAVDSDYYPTKAIFDGAVDKARLLYEQVYIMKDSQVALMYNDGDSDITDYAILYSSSKDCKAHTTYISAEKILPTDNHPKFRPGYLLKIIHKSTEHSEEQLIAHNGRVVIGEGYSDIRGIDNTFLRAKTANPGKNRWIIYDYFGNQHLSMHDVRGFIEKGVFLDGKAVPIIVLAKEAGYLELEITNYVIYRGEIRLFEKRKGIGLIKDKKAEKHHCVVQTITGFVSVDRRNLEKTILEIEADKGVFVNKPINKRLVISLPSIQYR